MSDQAQGLRALADQIRGGQIDAVHRACRTPSDPRSILSLVPERLPANAVIVVATPEPSGITRAYVAIKAASRENPGARLMLVVNMVNSSGEGAAIAGRLKRITRQFLNCDLEYLGFLPMAIS